MIVVLDTNVLVAGLLKPFGPSAAVLRLVLTGTVQAAHDYRILAEYREVLSRPVFGFAPAAVGALLTQIEEDGVPVTPPPVSFPGPDPTDAPFWEAALTAVADFLITGNQRHFPKKKEGPRVVSPAEFMTEFEETVPSK
jgi:putative PIN family toxin of toxin-antitoxin system